GLKAGTNRLAQYGVESPEAISAGAVAFAQSRPVAEVAKHQRKVTASDEDREWEEHEAAENRVTRVVTPQAQADADAAAQRGIVRDPALQTKAPALAMP